jgi:formiminoglutamase
MIPLQPISKINNEHNFHKRRTYELPINGNPIRCLIEDGLPGPNLCQIGLSPFANTAAMHGTTDEIGSGVFTIAEVKARGIAAVVKDALARVDHCEKIMVDFDIDVIDRAQCPGAPGARPGGMSADTFFAAARILAAQPKVALVDLTEFDPSLDVGDITALTAARWVCEVLAGFSKR